MMLSLQNNLRARFGPMGCKNAMRSMSQLQTQEKKGAGEVEKAKPAGSEVTEKPDIKAEIDALAKDSKDNFLIEFRDRKPTYDQLFEYKIDDVEHNKVKVPKEIYYLRPEILLKLHKKYDMSPLGIKSWYRERLNKMNVKNQEYNIRRHGILGPDLACAHFVTARSGKVRFKHKPDFWVLEHRSLPGIFDKKFKLLSVDASNMALIWEGLDNFILLNDLEELHLRNNRLDDFACDKISRMFRNSTTMEYLDLSGNKDISHRGLECMYQIPSLKRLIIKDTKAAEYEFLELVILMLQDIRPELEVIYKD